MGSSFNRWEKDPFFSAAEEVQESADRMESTYRTWLYAKNDVSSMWNAEELRRDLRTALGTTKWQLEEFERAVRSSYLRSSNDDSRERHRDFVVVIQNMISKVGKSLDESSLSEGKASSPWVRLDEGECNELTLFLSGSPTSQNKNAAENHGKDNENLHVSDKGLPPHCPKSLHRLTDRDFQDSREEKLQAPEKHGHRRTASAGICSWKIAVFDEGQLPSSSGGQPEQLVRKIPSFSGFLNTMESASKLKWVKNGFRKWKASDSHHESDTAILQNNQLSTGVNACFDKSKSCLDSYDDGYDKQINGWYGAIYRRLQRSQYQLQYSRTFQVTCWMVVLLFLIGLFTPCNGMIIHLSICEKLRICCLRCKIPSSININIQTYMHSLLHIDSLILILFIVIVGKHLYMASLSVISVQLAFMI